MRGDFSQLFSTSGAHCVLHQQGRVLREADLNEQNLRLWERLADLAKDVQSLANNQGAFKFKLGGESGTSIQLPITLPDKLYVGGFAIHFPAGEQIALKRDGQTQLVLQPDSRILLPEVKTDGTYVLFVELHQNVVTSLQEGYFMDAAIPGDAPSTRLIAEPVLRVLPTAQFEQLRRGALPAIDITLTPQRDLGNRLFRFEIHNPVAGQISIKWSRDNASPVFPLAKELDKNRLTIGPTDPNGLAALRQGSWIEFVDQAARQQPVEQMPRRLFRIEQVDRQQRILELDASPSDRFDPSNAVFIVWDHPPGEVEPNSGPRYRQGVPVSELTTPTVFTDHPGAFTVQLSSTGEARFWSGDYWLVPVRGGTTPIVARLRTDVRIGELLRFRYDGTNLLTAGTFAVDAVERLAQQDRQVPLEIKRIESLPAPTLPLPIRDVPLKILDIAVHSLQLQQWIASAQLSEVANLTLDALHKKITRSIEVPADQQELFAADLQLFVSQIQRIVNQLPTVLDLNAGNIA